MTKTKTRMMTGEATYAGGRLRRAPRAGSPVILVIFVFVIVDVEFGDLGFYFCGGPRAVGWCGRPWAVVCADDLGLNILRKLLRGTITKTNLTSKIATKPIKHAKNISPMIQFFV